MGWFSRIAMAMTLCWSAACAQKTAAAPTSPVHEHAAEPPPARPTNEEIPLPGSSRTFRTVAEANDELVIAETEIEGLLDSNQAAEELATGRCTRLCRSLTSMEAAVDALCELTGAADEQCETSRARLEKSRARVSDAGCAC